MPSDIAPGPINFIHQRENIYFRCVEDCNEPIMITDQSGRMIYVNPAWSRVYGYSASEAIGQTPRLLRSHHQDQTFYQEMWRQILKGEQGHWKGQLFNRAKDGREVPVLLTITPYRQQDGEILGYMGIALDLSEQKVLEQQVLQQERLATIGELTSGLAHEIGTPIGVIRGRAEMTQMVPDLPPAVGKAVDIIIKQTDRISSLIATLLRFSRSGQARVQLQPINLLQVVQETCELLSEKLRKNHIALNAEVPATVFVLGDSNRLEQVLLNLMMNSIHALQEEKNCSDPQAPAQPQILIHAEVHTNGKTVLLSVTDNGPGIAPAIQNKIFQPFFTTKPAGQGTGLGLSIVSRLVDEMMGRIRLDQQHHPGARFVIELQVQ